MIISRLPWGDMWPFLCVTWEHHEVAKAWKPKVRKLFPQVLIEIGCGRQRLFKGVADTFRIVTAMRYREPVSFFKIDLSAAFNFRDKETMSSVQEEKVSFSIICPAVAFTVPRLGIDDGPSVRQLSELIEHGSLTEAARFPRKWKDSRDHPCHIGIIRSLLSSNSKSHFGAWGELVERRSRGSRSTFLPIWSD